MNSKFKKILSVGAIVFAAGLALTACSGKKQGASTNKDTKHGIALITDQNGVDDHSFNQAAWAGFKAYGKEHGLKQGIHASIVPSLVSKPSARYNSVSQSAQPTVTLA